MLATFFVQLIPLDQLAFYLCMFLYFAGVCVCVCVCVVARLLSKNPLNLLCNIARGWKMRFLIRYRFR